MGFWGCADTSTPNPATQVVFAHLSPNAGPVDVLVNYALTLPADPYKQLSGSSSSLPYLTVAKPDSSPRWTVTVRPVAQATLLASAAPDLSAGGKHTVCLYDTLPSPKLLVLDDDFDTPALGHAKVRLVHTVLGVASTITFSLGYVVGQDSVAGIGYGSATSYIEVPAGTASLKLRYGGVDLMAGSAYASFAFAQNKVYTIYATGIYKEGDISQVAFVANLNN